MRLKSLLHSIDASWTFTDTDLETLAESDVRRGYPAPTILLKGRDLFGLPAPLIRAMGCRVYPGGLPSAHDLAERIGGN